VEIVVSNGDEGGAKEAHAGSEKRETQRMGFVRKGNPRVRKKR